MTASQVSQSVRDLYLAAFEEAVEKATKPQPLVRSQSVCEYCTRPNLSNSETCKGCGAPASHTSHVSGTDYEKMILHEFPYQRWAEVNQAHALGLINWRLG